MDLRIEYFIDSQKAASVCCLDAGGHPYCFTVFFALDTEKQLLYYKSSHNSYHGHVMEEGHRVAGTILPDKLNTLAIKGVQFTGTVLALDDPLSNAGPVYYGKFPFAAAMPGEIWTIQLETVKFTDNSLGFGKKVLWRRGEEVTSLES
jgi:uncharacterized protein